MKTEQMGLRRRVAELERALAEAERAAETDALTASLNRRGWDVVVAREDARCRRHDLDAIVAVVDLDGFKAVNDRGGHSAGDEVLRRCAVALRGALRTHDAVARLGGDEFAVLAVQTSPAAASAVVERVGAALEDARVAATVGAAARSEAGSLEEAWHLADRRMLAGKQSRRGADALD